MQVLLTGTNTPATIFSDDGITTTTNPVTTDSQGRFGFFVADGRYDLKVSGVNFTTFTLTNIEIADLTEASGSDVNWITEQLNHVNQAGDPATPAAGTLAVYSKSSNKHLFVKDETGLVTDLMQTTGGSALLGANNSFTATNTFPNINNEIWVDGTTYPISCTGLQNAINATTSLAGGLSFGTVVHLPPQSISCSTQVTFPVGQQIILRGSGPGSQIVNLFGTDALFLAKGVLGASTTTTAGLSAGALSVTVTNGAAFSAFQWVEIASVSGDPAYYPCPNTAPAGAGGQCNSELVLLDSVAGNTLNFKTSISNAYTSGATVTVVTPAVVQFEDFSIKNVGASFPAIKFWYCINCGATNMNISGGLFVSATVPALQLGFYHTTQSFVRGGFFGNFDGTLAGGIQSAAFVVAGASSHITFDSPHVYKYVENAIVEASHDIAINGGDYSGCADSCWNTHSDGNYRVTFNGGNYGGITPNSSYNGICIYVSYGAATRSGLPDRDVQINGINCHDYGIAGIAANGGAGIGGILRVSVNGGNIVNQLKQGNGLIVSGCNSCTATGVNIRDVFTNSIGILAQFNQNVTLTGNIGIQGNGAAGTTGLLISQGTVDSVFAGNVLTGYAVGLSASTSANTTIVANNIAYGNTLNYNYDGSTSITRWNNIGDTFSANTTGDSPHRATFGPVFFNTNGVNTFGTEFFDKSIKIIRMGIIPVPPPVGCSTLAQFVVTDGTTSTSTISVANGSSFQDSGAISTAFPINDSISVRQTAAAAGCSTTPTAYNVSYTYETTGS